MWIWLAFVVLGLVGEQFRRFSLQPMTRTRQRARQRRGARRGHSTPVGINTIQKRLDATKCDATGPERRVSETLIQPQVKFRLTPGQTHDITQAATLREGLTAKQVIADKGYDGDKVLQTIHDQGGQAVIPPKSNRKVQRPYDKELYRERNHIERLFARLKQCRRIATRYDKTARNFLAFLHLAATMILLA